MADEITPTLDRHVQEQLGDVLRERFEDDGDERGLPPKLETLMATLSGGDRGDGSSADG